MKRFGLIVAAALEGLSCLSARAEFAVSSREESSPAQQQDPVPDSGRQSATPDPRPVLPPAAPIARGFGSEVPLAFATRQIVPPGIRVLFGVGVEQDTVLVDWRGGRAWTDTLKAALRPAGLYATFRPGSVLITRPANSSF